MKTEGGRKKAQSKQNAERRFAGHGVSPGIAIGPVHVVESGMDKVPEYRIANAKIAAEIERFDDAVARSLRQVRKLRRKAQEAASATSEELGFLLEAHEHMLSGSRLVRGVAKRIREQQANAEHAVQTEISEIAKGFADIDDPYLAARVQDIRDVGMRLIRNLTKTPFHAFSDLPRGTIVIADELTPADTALLDPRRVAGFATALGGAEGHTAIMARSLGIPAVVAVPELVGALQSGDEVVVDGVSGTVVASPDKATVARYERRRDDLAREKRTLSRLRRAPAITSDGEEMTLKVNVELPVELETAKEVGAAGIGLLRSEFMFMNREDLPGEDEQYRQLKMIVEEMEGRPVTVRTLDVGGDKLATALGGHFADAANPALGLRAIRLGLKVPSLLETQLAAILRAGAHGPVRVLLPMISSVAEVRQVRKTVERVARRLRRRGARLADDLPPLGIMIEVPGAALAADALASAVDFFSIGTNDLTMYTLAIDRGDDQVADLYDPLHPAVLRLIQFATEAALRARLPVNLCGEMAGDPRYTALLLGLGLRELSMAGASLPRIKKRIRDLDLNEAMRRTRNIMDQADSGRIAAMLDDFNALA
jgi:phosphotransferase system enzyme I (PtsI)